MKQLKGKLVRSILKTFPRKALEEYQGIVKEFVHGATVFMLFKSRMGQDRGEE